MLEAAIGFFTGDFFQALAAPLVEIVEHGTALMVLAASIIEQEIDDLGKIARCCMRATAWLVTGMLSMKPPGKSRQITIVPDGLAR